MPIEAANPRRFALDIVRESLQAGEGVTGAIEKNTQEAIADLDNDRLQRILAEPGHENLHEALAADAVDAAPVAGDLLAGVRKRNADEQGVDYPDRPAFVENAISDLPPPIDTIGDILVSQNTLNYLETKD